MNIKLKSSGLIFLFVLSFWGCNESSTVSSNNGSMVVVPQVTKVNANNNANLADLKSRNADDYYKQVANKEKIKSDDNLNSGPKRKINVADEKTPSVVSEDKSEVQKIVVLEKKDKTKTVAVLLKKGIACEFPIEMIPKAKETPDEEILRIVEANKDSKMCVKLKK